MFGFNHFLLTIYKDVDFLQFSFLFNPFICYPSNYTHPLFSKASVIASDQLQNAGLQEVRLAGPGALARTLPGEIIRKLLYTEAYRVPFIERCYQFDSEPSVCGLGIHS